LNDEYNEQKAKRRLKQAMQGAFSGPPTPLKDIPTRAGESRAARKPEESKEKQATSARKRKKPAEK